MRVSHTAASDPSIVGREAELATLDEFLGADRAGSACVLSGGPGIGKTTLWESGVAAARNRRQRVLSARPSDAEARLSFATLIDLLDGVGSDELEVLPAWQLHALEVALLRAAPTGSPPDAHAVAVGFRNALRALAEHVAVVVAIDDIQWLDAQSAAGLTFAARGVGEDRVRFLLARRPGPPTSLEQALGPGRTTVLEVAPLTLDGTRRLLHDRLGLTPSRALVRRVFDATLGNPFFVLEVGRTLAEHGEPGIGEELPVPATIDGLLGTRVAALPGGVRRALLAVALSPGLMVAQLEEVAAPDAVDAAIAAGVLVVDRDRVRPSHPLVSATVTRDADPDERRGLHGALSAVVVADELRTRHLALATSQPDGVLAAHVAAAARDASARGATHAAVELADHALRLTPSGDPERDERMLELAAHLQVAGEKERLTTLLVPALESLPAGSARARAYLLLTSGAVDGNREILEYLESALAESRDDPQLRAAVLAELAANVAAIRLERIPMTEAWASEALRTARDVEVGTERKALYALAWARSLGGHPVDELAERFRTLSETAFYVALWPERIAAQRLVWRGALHEARETLLTLWTLADERGEPSSYALQRLHVCELELRSGAWDAAERLLDEWSESSDSALLLWPMYERCRALLAAGRGDVADAVRWADEAIARARRRGSQWDRLEALRALGIARLLAREPENAAEALGAVWEHMENEGIREPGVFPVAPDLVEALVDLERREQAGAVADRLAELADAQSHPWGIATARRSRAVIRLAEGYDDGAVAQLAHAAREYARLGLGFDAARSLLALGRAQRRFRKWGAARDTLLEAAASFDALGSPGWAAATRAELERVGARRPSRAGELSAAERRVAELAASGLPNKEIARALVVTVSTVEYHLSRTYAKLGIRSRAQLAGRLRAGTQARDDPGS